LKSLIEVRNKVFKSGIFKGKFLEITFYSFSKSLFTQQSH
jgi:hypothetical protein